VISRGKATAKVLRAINERTSVAWDAAWDAIRRLESRGVGQDADLAAELAAKMASAARPEPKADRD
jgi:hypothetical protein